MNCVQWFWKAYPAVLAFHVPNGELRDRRTAEKLQRMGVLSGVWDWLIFTADFKAIIEFKRPDGGVLSDKQNIFAELWESTGGKVCGVVETLNDFKSLCVELLGEPVVTYDASAPLEIDEAAVQQMIEAQPAKMPWD